MLKSVYQSKEFRDFLMEDQKLAEQIQEMSNEYKQTGQAVSGNDPFRKGMILSHPGAFGAIDMSNPESVGSGVGHSGIQYEPSSVVESGAIPGTKICLCVHYDYNNWDSRGENFYGMGVCATSQAQDDAVANWCADRADIQLPYNYNFFNIQARDQFYCSHLVWAGYLDVTGVNLLDSGATANAIVSPNALITSRNTSVEFYHE